MQLSEHYFVQLVLDFCDLECPDGSPNECLSRMEKPLKSTLVDKIVSNPAEDQKTGSKFSRGSQNGVPALNLDFELTIWLGYSEY